MSQAAHRALDGAGIGDIKRDRHDARCGRNEPGPRAAA
jgi:vancomycin resistance protein YoaR